jgi:putative ABC transport system substrate-binding protein
MRRREFMALAAGGAAWPMSTNAQQQSARVVGLLGVSFISQVVSAFVIRLRDLGWAEGRNVVIEPRWAAGDLSRFPALVDELVRLKPDVMVAGNMQAAIAMRDATVAIPIVCANLIDPVRFGLIASHARPGGNVTGIQPTVDTLPEKQLALAAEIVPGTTKMGMLLKRRLSSPQQPTERCGTCSRSSGYHAGAGGDQVA